MTDDQPKERTTGNPPKNPAKIRPEERLKRALRENLKRRKSQARGRGDLTAAPSNPDDLPPHDGSGKKPDE